MRKTEFLNQMLGITSFWVPQSICCSSVQMPSSLNRLGISTRGVMLPPLKEFHWPLEKPSRYKVFNKWLNIWYEMVGVKPVWKRTSESCADTTHKLFPSVERASTLLYAQETTTAHLGSPSCFPDRLIILNEERILSNDQWEKGILQKV